LVIGCAAGPETRASSFREALDFFGVGPQSCVGRADGRRRRRISVAVVTVACLSAVLLKETRPIQRIALFKTARLDVNNRVLLV
jgi:hypothetical protein